MNPHNNLLISLNKNRKSSRMTSNNSLTKSEQGLDTHRNEKSISIILGDEEISDLKCQLIAQSGLIREYESWVHLLLNLIQNKNDGENHHDCATPIQKGLEKIQQMQNENFELKKKLLKEVNLNHASASKIEGLKAEYESICTEIKDVNKDQLKKEKEQLLASIDTVVEELDEISKRNKKLERFSKTEDFQETNQIYKELLSQREENSTLQALAKYENERKSRRMSRAHLKSDIFFTEFEDDHNRQRYNCLSSKNLPSRNSNYSGRYSLNI